VERGEGGSEEGRTRKNGERKVGGQITNITVWGEEKVPAKKRREDDSWGGGGQIRQQHQLPEITQM